MQAVLGLPIQGHCWLLGHMATGKKAVPRSPFILLAIMASGLNGQSFAFNGYLPIDKTKGKRIKELERISKSSNQTQLFIETPYRNDKMLDDLIEVWKKHFVDNLR